jgi:hypothetical protein
MTSPMAARSQTAKPQGDAGTGRGARLGRITTMYCGTMFTNEHPRLQDPPQLAIASVQRITEPIEL